jgi:hypothetical protein
MRFELQARGPGTETNYIVAHEGKLFATISTWNSTDPQTQITILRKDSPSEPWVEEFRLPKTPERAYTRSEIMRVLTFRSDIDGKPLVPPKTVLLIASGQQSTNANRFPWSNTVWARVGPGDFRETVLSTDTVRPCDGDNKPSVRSMDVFFDPGLGRDALFVGTGSGRVYRGGYDPTTPGLLRFEPNPIFQGSGRILSLTATPWGLFASCSRKVAPDACTRVTGLPDVLLRYTGRRTNVDVSSQPLGDFERVGTWESTGREAEDSCRGLTVLPHPTKTAAWCWLEASRTPANLCTGQIKMARWKTPWTLQSNEVSWTS